MLFRSDPEGSSPLARGLRGRGLSLPRQLWGSSPLARGLRAAPDHSHRRLGIIPARAGFTSDLDNIYKILKDHPRSRGVYPCPSRAIGYARGSSPLARGLRGLAAGRHRRVGIIPARAGFTRGSVGGAGGRRDHPRSRGVYTAPGGPSRAHRGSSPLARGLHRPAYAQWGKSRIIPARAGFTNSDRRE